MDGRKEGEMEGGRDRRRERWREIWKEGRRERGTQPHLSFYSLLEGSEEDKKVR